MNSSDNLQPSDDDARFYELVTRHLASELDADGAALLTQLLSESEDRRAEFVAMAWHMRLLAVRVAPKWQAQSTSAVQSIWQRAWHQILNSFDSLAPRGFRPITLPKLAAFAVVSLLTCYFGFLAVSVIWEQSHRLDRVAQTPSNAADATIVSLADCVWEGVTPKAGEQLTHQQLHLMHGLVELRFDRGARVIIEGPATFETRSNNAGFLQSGKLVARVPTAAVGFAIETPSATIIDLGTEFTVEADPQGQTQVQVLEGKVELRPGITAHASSQASRPITISAGEARRIEPVPSSDRLIVSEIEPTPERFTRTMPPSLTRRLNIAGAIASSDYPARDRRVNHLVDGSGVRGERHSNVADGTMWHTNLGKVKGEFVLFDLGVPRRLDSMKVWNYNENFGFEEEVGVAKENRLFTSRGVKQADIYISTSGKWDPFKEPSEWRLIVADRQFSPADGTASYSTPDVISLGNVEARFVAMVIDANLGPDPRSGSLSDEDCVGLSEVQFFGEPAKKPPRSGTRP